MAAWSPQIANEFIRRAKAEGRALTQMQLQKLVYIAHGWTLAITDQALTHDVPEAWEYGPVYKQLRRALRSYGRDGVSREIRNGEFSPGVFEDDDEASATASLSAAESAIVDRVYRDYGKFHGFQLSALTHKDGTPWSRVYRDGGGQYSEIPSALIRDHFVELAQANRPHNN